ncbi:2-aminoethylphosphonate--pyruvate transaminase [Crateriforma conspicua]|uniref:2-aminoethylphosphonate--pyruvate transaminase n=1 Tax=Crateriforma conspicua TaxID=2527996 RepID=A0A5C6FZ24_9PLAN|nr:2-aminoethylphosphonate--pyruvate transaminase [Crateriforma conspicua]TWU66223.1 2-aminoethylphosphonate--pyruvate transaminase [Crateriforma conspicua]
MDDDIPYLLLTPGPLTTSRGVRQSMLRDYCTWDADYNQLVADLRKRLVMLAGGGDRYTAVLMQGSGTFSVEATIGSVIPPDGKLLVISNGAYGRRMTQIARRLSIDHSECWLGETQVADSADVRQILQEDPAISHVAIVHCETSTGMLNPIESIGAVCRQMGKVYIVDAMSSFGGIPMSMESVGADFMISSANKCIQGVPGFGFVIADRDRLSETKGRARSLSLDLYDQWSEMESKGGKWRYTSPTHVVRAFVQAMDELDAEGGVAARHQRYCENHRRLVDGVAALGITALLPAAIQSPIITSFLYPDVDGFAFDGFYQALKQRRFVIYPGKVSDAQTFRIGNIGHVFPEDIDQLVAAIAEVIGELTVASSR